MKHLPQSWLSVWDKDNPTAEEPLGHTTDSDPTPLPRPSHTWASLLFKVGPCSVSSPPPTVTGYSLMGTRLSQQSYNPHISHLTGRALSPASPCRLDTLYPKQETWVSSQATLPSPLPPANQPYSSKKGADSMPPALNQGPSLLSQETRHPTIHGH